MTEGNGKRWGKLPARGSDPSPEPVQPEQGPGNAPEGQPGKERARPEAERPRRRGAGTVSDPDQYPSDPPRPKAERPPTARVLTTSNPDFGGSGS